MGAFATAEMPIRCAAEISDSRYRLASVESISSRHRSRTQMTMSHDPAAAVIGAQLVEMGTRAMAAGTAAAPSVTALAPAGAEEVSVQAAAAFGAEAASVLAAQAAAHEELMRTGGALIDIARMYAQADMTAAGALEASAVEATAMTFRSAAISTTQLARGAAASMPAGVLSAEALQGAAGTAQGAAGAAARTPLMANLIEGVAGTNPSTAVPAAANAASTVLGAGTAPLSSIGSMAQGAGAGAGAAGGSAPSLASSVAGDESESDRNRDSEDPNGQQTCEQLV
jgi:hypothetical protein